MYGREEANVSITIDPRPLHKAMAHRFLGKYHQAATQLHDPEEHEEPGNDSSQREDMRPSHQED